jgi:hypothetical protein
MQITQQAHTHETDLSQHNVNDTFNVGEFWLMNMQEMSR